MTSTHGKFSEDTCQTRLLGRLMTDPSRPDPLEPEDYLYFGQHAFPLACQWLTDQIQQAKAASEGTYGTNPVLDGVSTPYLIMLRTPSVCDIRLHS